MYASVLRVFLVSVLLWQPAWASSAWTFDNVERVVALSDIHGAFDAMVRTLQNAQVLDEAHAWAGAGTHLVIVGDLLDRGPDSRKAMDLLMRLEVEAAAAGGAVHVLIGNHEAMNLMGDLRYVSKEEYAAFAADETSAERDRWFDAFAERYGTGTGKEAQRAFDRKYPSGYFAHRRAFAADGVYGKWLLAKPIIVVINRTAFVHAGLSPMIAALGLEGVNQGLHADIQNYVKQYGVLEAAGVLLPTDSAQDRETVLQAFRKTDSLAPETVATIKSFQALAESDLHAADGPLWYRGNVYCGQLIELDRLQASLQALGADRVVIGHTPTTDREIQQRFAGRVYEVDTGMLHNYYGGEGHALVISGDTVRVVSEDSVESIAPEAHPRRVGARPGGKLSAAELERLLAGGEVSAEDKGLRDGSIVSVAHDGDRVRAVFRKRAGKNFYPEVAAYRLDLLLELGMVPVAVVREVEGMPGSLQFLPDKILNEEQRAASGQGASAYCSLTDQWPVMYVFDSLIYNEGRSRDRMLYSTDIWQLLLVGHEKAFATKKGRPRHLKQVPLAVNGAWESALLALDEATIEQTLGDVLDTRRQRALLARRDELLAEFR